LIEAVDNIKVLDPACGSGAFPMGILHKLVFILSKLDPNNQLWKERQLANATRIEDPVVREKWVSDIEDSFERNQMDYGRKLYLIQNCIYGVDIQPIAVQIAKLRFFISLIVDQKPNDERENRGILPLPNLETKFVAANTLIGLDKPKLGQTLILRNPEIIQKEKQLSVVRQRYFTARTQKTKQKCKDEDTRLRFELSAMLVRDGFTGETALKLANWDPYDQNTFAGWFDSEWMFGLTGGFDIVIANPPYILLQNVVVDSQSLEEIKHQYESAQYKIDTYQLFIELGINLMVDNGVLAYITPNTFIKNKYSSKLRKIIVEKTTIEDFVLFYTSVFEASSVDNLIIICRKTNSRNHLNHTIKIHEIRTDFSSELYRAKLFVQARILPEDYLFEFDISGDTEAIVDKLLSGSVEFGKIGRAYFGIQTFDRAKFVSEYQRTPVFKPVIDGANIHRYWLNPPSEFVEFKPEAIKSGGNADVYKRQRIVVRQIGEFPFGTLCPSGLYTLNTVYNLYLEKRGYDIRYILAILNSRLIKFFWSVKFYDQKATFPKIKKKPLECIPVKIVTQDTQKTFITLVNQILSITQDERYTENHGKQTEVKRIEEQIDLQVYKLYELTPEQIAVVESREQI
jgi:adenine-specific DNA-methyltransferase